MCNHVRYICVIGSLHDYIIAHHLPPYIVHHAQTPRFNRLVLIQYHTPRTKCRLRNVALLHRRLNPSRTVDQQRSADRPVQDDGQNAIWREIMALLISLAVHCSPPACLPSPVLHVIHEQNPAAGPDTDCAAFELRQNGVSGLVRRVSGNWTASVFDVSRNNSRQSSSDAAEEWLKRNKRELPTPTRRRSLLGLLRSTLHV